jgi:CHAT domain-containing protein/tetratricopeptide (TPR) repeat protein
LFTFAHSYIDYGRFSYFIILLKMKWPYCIIRLSIKTSIALILLLNASGAIGRIDKSDPAWLYHEATNQFNRNAHDSAFVNFRLAVKHALENQQHEVLIRSLLFMANIKRLVQEYDSAFYFLSLSKEVLSDAKSEDKTLWADYYHRTGATYLSRGDYESARGNLSKSLQIRIDAQGDSDTNLVLTYTNLGITSYYLGLYELARSYYERAHQVIALGEIKSSRSIANCFQNTGILYATIGNYEKASHYFQLSLSVYEAVFSSYDPSLGRLYLNFGRMLQLSGQVEKALSYYNKAEDIFRVSLGEDHSLIGSIYMNKATIYTSYSDYERAFNYNNRALSIFQRNLGENHHNTLIAYMNLGYYYEKKEDYQNAIVFYEKSLNRDYQSSNNIKAFRNMANLFSLIGNTDQSDYFYNKAINTSIELFGSKHPETALSYVNYARFLTENEYFEKSKTLLFEAKSIYLGKHGEKDRDYANTLIGLGNNYMKQGKPTEALSLLQQSIVSLTDGFAEKNPKKNPDREHLAADQFLLNALYLKAKNFYQLYQQDNEPGHLNISLETYELSSILLNEIRNSYIGQESRLIITAIATEILADALDCTLELYRLTMKQFYLEKAFEFAEKGKAVVLLAALSDLEAKELAHIPDEVRALERSLRLGLESYNQLIYDERLSDKPDESKITLWQTQLFNFNIRYDSLINAIFEQYPDYYELRFDLNTIPLTELQKGLSSNQTLLEYTLSGKQLFIFAIASDTTIAVRKQLPDTFYNDLESFRKHLDGSKMHNYSHDDYREFIQISNDIYNCLIKPIENVLAGRNLIIIPDNQLGYLPFEVLLSDTITTGNIDFKNLPYFLKRHAISYAYSATLLKRETVKSRNNGKILAFAPEYDSFESNVLSTSRHQNLLPIPWALDEVKTITRKYRGTAVTGLDATEKAFKKKSSDYLVLHLAMHSIIDNKNPMYSRFVFSYPTDTLEDGLLNTFELFNLDLNAMLAVLSACQTGDGRLQRGEGIMSLARGFFYAGIPSIIMTLWEVDDQVSSQITLLLYDKLAKGLNKDDALRYAKIDFLSATDRLKAHPHYWAGFVTIGNTDAVTLKKPFSKWAIIIPFALLFILILLLLRQKIQA